MSSTGTFGINSDNFNISGNTNINNLVVSGTTSFPSNSISGSAISSSVANATLAATATNALACSGNAATATNATTAANSISCSGNAATATVASNALACSGNAATATKAYLTQSSTTDAGTYNIVFTPVQASSGNNNLYQTGLSTGANTLAFVPLTGQLKGCTVGTATNATNATNLTITGGTSTGSYNILIVGNGNGTVSAAYAPTTCNLAIATDTLFLSGLNGISLNGGATYTATGTGTGNLGCIISGTIATTYSSVALATPSTLSSITLSPGVWMITASISATASTSGAGLFLCISTAGSTAFNASASTVSVASTTKAGGFISTVISTTAAAPVYNFLCYSSAGTGSATVGQFYAVRIA